MGRLKRIFNQREAAEYAQVDIRTVRRRTKNGKLYRRPDGKYDQAEILKLKRIVDLKKDYRFDRKYGFAWPNIKKAAAALNVTEEQIRGELVAGVLIRGPEKWIYRGKIAENLKAQKVREKQEQAELRRNLDGC